MLHNSLYTLILILNGSLNACLFMNILIYYLLSYFNSVTVVLIVGHLVYY